MCDVLYYVQNGYTNGQKGISSLLCRLLSFSLARCEIRGRGISYSLLQESTAIVRIFQPGTMTEMDGFSILYAQCGIIIKD